MVTSMGAMLEPLERRALPFLVAERLRQAIADGEYLPGQQLPTEPELARQIGVGRTSLREAIQRLKTLGLVEVRSGLGTFVVEAGRADPIITFTAWAAENEFEVSEVFEARLSLEVTAAGLAAERSTSRDEAKLRAAARDHISAETLGSIDDLVQTDEAFHRTLVALGRNALISRLYDILVPDLAQYRRVSLALPGSARRSGADHMAIVDAVAVGDSDAAKAAVTEHISVLRSEVAEAAKASRHAAKRSPVVTDEPAR